MYPHPQHLSPCWPIAALLFLVSFAQGADVHVTPRTYRVSLWGSKDGLPDDSVTACLQTRDGYIWVGTEKGLARFDGVVFRVFDTWNTKELHSDRIAALAEDSQGTLWVGTKGGGVTQYREGRFSHAGLPSQFVNALCTSRDGRVWGGTSGGGLFSFTSGAVASYSAGSGLPDLFVQELAKDHEGTLWIGTRDAGLVAMRGETFASPPIGGPALSRSVTALFVDDAGRLWIGTRSGLFVRVGGQLQRITTADGLPNDHVLAVAGDRRGRIWVGTAGGTASIQVAKDGVVDPGSARRVDKAVSAIATDAEGNVWMGGPGTGLRRLTRTRVASLTARDGLSHEAVNCVYADGAGRLWFGTPGGLNRLNGEVLSGYNGRAGLANPGVTALREDSAGALWIGTRHGMKRLVDGALQSCPEDAGWPTAGVWDILEDRSGVLWIGTADGLIERSTEGLVRHTVGDGLPANDVRALAEGRDGRLWIGTSHGLAFRSGGAFEVASLPQGLLTRIVLALHADARGTLWCGTLGGGLIRYAAGSATVYTTREGFPDNTVYGIVDDGLGFYWLSSNRGLFRVRIAELERLAAGRPDTVSPTVFRHHDGMPSEVCRGFGQPAGCRTRDGRLWFATSKGVAVIDPGRLSTNLKAPPVVIERLVVDGQSIERREHIDIGPDGEQFEFHFAGLSYADPKRVRFKYRLEGFDQDWTDADTRRVAYYTRLPPGSYRFHVTACNNDDVWNRAGASMTLAIVPHFWETWWFLGGAAAAVVLGIAGTVRYVSTRRLNRQLRQLEREQALERERTRIARDLHDEVGAKLTRVARLVEVGRRGDGAGDDLRPVLDGVADATGELVQSMDEIVWTVNPGNDSLENMATYLLHYAEEFLRGTAIAYELDVPVILPDVTLTADVRHNLFMVVKEALSNAVKHGNPGNIRLGLRAADDALIIQISDDGKGFVPAERPPTSNGIDNMLRRMEGLGGTLDIRSAPGDGTEVVLRSRCGM